MARRAIHPETRDVWPKALLAFGAGLLVFLVLAAIVLKLVFDTAPRWPAPGAALKDGVASPALQVAPAGDLAAFRAREDEELARLGWVDRATGIARIPVANAMAIVARDGLPDWPASGAAAKDECALLERNVPRAPQAADGCARDEEATRP